MCLCVCVCLGTEMDICCICYQMDNPKQPIIGAIIVNFNVSISCVLQYNIVYCNILQFYCLILYTVFIYFTLITVLVYG